MGFAGVTYCLSQAVVAKWVVKHTKGKTSWLVVLCLACLAVGRTSCAFATHIAVMFIGTGFVILAVGVLNTGISTAVSQIASTSEVGGLIGVIEAVESSTGIIGPMVGGLVGGLSPLAPLYMVLSMYAVLSTATLLFYSRTVDSRIAEMEAKAKAAAESSGSSNSDKQASIPNTSNKAAGVETTEEKSSAAA